MKKIIMKAYAKINLCFDITGKDDESGMHYVDTIMQTIDLYDYVTLTKRKDKECTSSVEGDVVVDTNAVAAAKLFVETFGTNGVDISIIKNIPVGAGLGGSSADAAAVLRGMAVLYGVDFCEVKKLAKQIGADVTFLMNGGLARCTGFGEQIEPLAQLPTMTVLLATPKSGVDTAEAYARFDKQSKKQFSVKTDDVLKNLREGKSNRLLSTNIFFNIVAILNPDVNIAAKYINADKVPMHATMTGSGSGYYSLYSDVEKAYAHMAHAPSELLVRAYQFVSQY